MRRARPRVLDLDDVDAAFALPLDTMLESLPRIASRPDFILCGVLRQAVRMRAACLNILIDRSAHCTRMQVLMPVPAGYRQRPWARPRFSRRVDPLRSRWAAEWFEAKRWRQILRPDGRPRAAGRDPQARTAWIELMPLPLETGVQAIECLSGVRFATNGEQWLRIRHRGRVRRFGLEHAAAGDVRIYLGRDRPTVRPAPRRPSVS